MIYCKKCQAFHKKYIIEKVYQITLATSVIKTEKGLCEKKVEENILEREEAPYYKCSICGYSSKDEISDRVIPIYIYNDNPDIIRLFDLFNDADSLYLKELTAIDMLLANSIINTYSIYEVIDDIL